MELNNDYKNAERIAKALGDPYRIRILEAVRGKETWTQCSVVVGMFNLSQPTVSHHINQLVDAGLLTAEKEGRNLKFKINSEVFGKFLSFISGFQSA